MLLQKAGHQYLNNGSLSILASLNRQTLFDAFQIFMDTYADAAQSLALVAVAFASLFYLRKHPDSRQGKFALALFVALFVIVFLYVNFAPPFGAVFGFLLTKFSLLLTFRYSISSFFYFIYFIFGALFAIGSAYLLDKLYKTRKALAISFAFVLLLILLARIYYTDYIPALVDGGITIPQYVFNLSNYVNAQKGDFNVGLLPAEVPFFHYATWYAGTDIYCYFIERPTFTGGYNSYSEVFFPPSQIEYFNITSELQRNLIENSTPSAKELGALGIRYLVVQGDTMQSNGYEAYNFTNMSHNLQAGGFALLKTFGNSSVYENRFYVPLVYAANLTDIGNESATKVFAYLGNNVTDITGTAVYSDSSAVYNSTGKAEIAGIPGFSAPEINFSENDPTSVTVKVSNATTPFYLVFRETYDPQWAAYYPNGTAVSAARHIEVNGFASAWYLSKKGNYTMTLYYTPQTMEGASWIVSFIGLAAICYVGWLGYEPNAKAARRNGRKEAAIRRAGDKR